EQGIVRRKVCFSLMGSCCFKSSYILTQNCSDFMIYRLPSTSINNICSRYCTTPADPCDPNPCLHDSICSVVGKNYQCTCLANFTGRNCQSDLYPCRNNPCIHGTCQNINYGYNCTCPIGYRGINCELDIDECVENKSICTEGCTNTNGSYLCGCDAGYQVSDDGKTCYVIKLSDPSRSTQINNTYYHSKCDQVNWKYTWYQFSGSNLSQMMVTGYIKPLSCGTTYPGWLQDNHPTNSLAWYRFKINSSDMMLPTEPTQRTCQNQATAWMVDPHPLNKCNRHSCGNKGVCIGINETYFYCQCQSGYTGKKCEKEINECQSNLCSEGTCIDLVNEYVCICPKGMTGVNCHLGINECATNKGGCSHKCHDLIPGQECSCPNDKILGIDRHTCIDPCHASAVVLNDTSVNSSNCQDQNANLERNCPYWHALLDDGKWYRANYGSNCSSIARRFGIKHIDDCASDPCRRGACSMLQYGFKCLCDAGDYGLYCQLSKCQSNPCQNGNCVPTVFGYRCRCRPGFSGAHCEISACNSNPCINGGKCLTMNNGGYQCRCNPGYHGLNCEVSSYLSKKVPLIPPSGLKYLYHSCSETAGVPQAWRVYCDFSSEPGYAWTLIESFSFDQRSDKKFNTAFPYSSGVNNGRLPQGMDWSNFRLSLAQIKFSYENDHQLSDPMWRATCNFKPETRYSQSPLNYMRGYFRQFNILNYVSQGQCFQVDYMDIRGHKCRNCNRAFWASSNSHLHTDSSTTRCCDGKVCYPNSVGGEDNFGYYQSYNPKFTCSSTPQSTTNWWIGGKI
ncbi:Neurogenic locus Notch protein, partial [Trichoplax sp. H2]